MVCIGKSEAMALTAQQRDTLHNIGTGTVGSYPVQRGPERKACMDMAFGRPRKCPCYACTKAREVIQRINAFVKANPGKKVPRLV